MRIIKQKAADQSVHQILEVVAILETIPIQAFGNSSDGVEKMARVYDNLAELAYTVDGVHGLNKCIVQFDKRARNMDEILAVSKAHIKVIDKHTKRRKAK